MKSDLYKNVSTSNALTLIAHIVEQTLHDTEKYDLENYDK